MKFSLSWLKKYVDITNTPEQIADCLSFAGLEVESFETIGANLTGITTGKISAIDSHPNADKLVITQIDDGTKTHQIVTGATNIAVGDIVPVVLPGGVVASGMKIKEAKLRGIDSFGMLCSQEECGLEPTVDGIWILAKTTPLGVDFCEYAHLKDTIFDIAILPNRGDCQSVIGLSRELATLYNLDLTVPKISMSQTDTNNPFSVSSNTDLCPLYIGRYIYDIQTNQSPIWLQRRLEISGIRSISLIVDITNYVLLETGHPLHAFDETKCKSKNIRVDHAKQTDVITTLDDQKRDLKHSQLVIYDENTPVALAGIMGGAGFDVDDSTKSIFLEAAYFDAISIRRSGVNSGLRTDSSIRFEKGIDITTVDFASQRACELLHQLANAKISANTAIYKNESDTLFNFKEIPCDLDQINSFLGSNYTHDDMINTLSKLGFSYKNSVLKVPSWRTQDIQKWPCIAEEIARLKGFDSIQATLPQTAVIQDKKTPLVTLTESTQDMFVAQGFKEINTYPMISSTDFNTTSAGTITDSNSLANPISDQLSIMRDSLLASFLHVVSYHHLRQLTDLALFEVGKTFHENSEDMKISLCISGQFFENCKSKSELDVSKNLFQHLSKVILNWATTSKLPISFTQETLPKWAHPKLYQTILLGKKPIGTIAMIHPTCLDAFNLTNDVCFAEFSLQECAELNQPLPTYTSFSRFPSTRRDIALVVPKSLTYNEILAVISKFKHKSVVDVGVFDVFESEKLGADNKSLAIYLIYQDKKTTLSDDKVNKAHSRLCDMLTKELPVSIR